MPAETLRTTRSRATANPLGPLATRLLRDGAHTLADTELVALLLGDDPVRPRSQRAQPTARAALRRLSAFRGSLRELAHIQEAAGGRAGIAPQPGSGACEAHESVPESGQGGQCRAILQAALEFSRRCLGEALQARPPINSPAELRAFLKLWLRERPRECFVVLFLDSQNRLICAEEMFQGTVAQTMVYPREIARRAIETGACALIVAHNHPSGTPTPSAADQQLTRALRQALALLDLPILDHVIVADHHCFSFAEAGLM